MNRSVLLFISSCLFACDNIGPEKNFPLPANSKFIFSEGDILRYTSDTGEEKFEVNKIVNGVYEDSQSGTCGKPVLYYYDFQVVYLKPVDTLNRGFIYLSERQDDCSGLGPLRNDLISSLNTTANEFFNRITWMTVYTSEMSKFHEHYAALTLRGHEFLDVFEYHVPEGQRLSRLYYTKKMGFVGFALKDGTLFSLEF
jgi:hypothetical protein